MNEVLVLESFCALFRNEHGSINPSVQIKPEDGTPRGNPLDVRFPLKPSMKKSVRWQDALRSMGCGLPGCYEKRTGRGRETFGGTSVLPDRLGYTVHNSSWSSPSTLAEQHRCQLGDKKINAGKGDKGRDGEYLQTLSNIY